jgi:hypothetical protein
MVPLNEMVRRSPCCAGRSTPSQLRRWVRRRSIMLSTSASVTSAVGRSMRLPLRSFSSICGNTSNDAMYA